MDYQYELRIPKERVAVLIGTRGAMKRKIEKKTATKLEVDSKEGDVFIQGNEALSCYTAKAIVGAVGRGFNPDIALQLVDPEFLYEELHMEDVAKTKKHMIRMKSRVIGSDGKARRIIEELTETNISVYGKTVGIIGPAEMVGIAKRAIESLLAGSPHSTVYTWLERQRTKMKRQQAMEDLRVAEEKALEMAKQQREISVAEFFEKNRHLLGFDNKRKSLLTTIKEAVDNSLDACEEARILPEILVEILELGNERFRITIEDNGPGIVKQQMPKIFGKLLYGSKFHKMSQTRGQQGIGISAAVLYAQLTTGRPAAITSKIGPSKPAYYCELHIDTATNNAQIVKEDVKEWKKEHGTKIELYLEGSYQRGMQSVDEYIKETAIVNPHATIIYTNPKAEQFIYQRSTQELPIQPKEIKPHPHGVELGMLIRMLAATQSRTLQGFLTEDFSRVGAGTAKEICQHASLLTNMKPAELTREQAEKLKAGIDATKIMAPPTDSISPIGSTLLEKGLKNVINAEFYATTSRPPSVYRGNPFVVEVGIAYGGELPKDSSATVLRFANRVPLLYQQGACATNESIVKTNWRQYGLSQSGNSLPQGPIVILVHMASVWVPFTSEAKEALAHYPEIIKEIKLALQECGRQLGGYLRKKQKVSTELKKRSYIEVYIPHIASALKDLLGDASFDDAKVQRLLKDILEKNRGKVEDVSFDKEKNKEFDESLALNFDKEEEQDDDEE